MIELALLGLLAPLTIWILWRIQAIAVDWVLRRALLRLLRHHGLSYSIVSWFGTLIHELSHATILLLTGHGIKGMRVRSESGVVSPRHERRGTIGFLSFLAAALAPIYLPPLLILMLAWWLLDRGLITTLNVADLGAAKDAGLLLVQEYPMQLLRALGGVDVTTWQGALMAFLLLVALPSARPSFVKGSKYHGEDDQGDIAVVRRRLRRRPWPLVGFFAVLYGLIFLTPWIGVGYWSAVALLWKTALTGILIALLGAIIWRTYAAAGGIIRPLGWIALLVPIALQVLARVIDWKFTLAQSNGMSLFLWVMVTLTLRVLAPRKTVKP